MKRFLSFITLLLCSAPALIANVAAQEMLKTISTYQVLYKTAEAAPPPPPPTAQEQAQSLISKLKLNGQAFEPADHVAATLAAIQGLHLSGTTKITVTKKDGSTASIKLSDIINMMTPQDHTGDSSDDEGTPAGFDFGDNDDEDFETGPTPAEQALELAQATLSSWKLNQTTGFFDQMLETQVMVLQMLDTGIENLKESSMVHIQILGSDASKDMTIEQVKNVIKHFQEFQKTAAQNIAKKWKAITDTRKKAQAVASQLRWIDGAHASFTNDMPVLEVSLAALQKLSGVQTYQVTMQTGQKQTVAQVVANLQSSIQKRQAAIKIQTIARMRQAKQLAQKLRLIKRAQTAVAGLTWNGATFTNSPGILEVAQQKLQEITAAGLSAATNLPVPGNDASMSIREIIDAITPILQNQAQQKEQAEKIIANMQLNADQYFVAKAGHSLAQIYEELGTYPQDLVVANEDLGLNRSQISEVLGAILESSAEPAKRAVIQIAVDESGQFKIPQGSNTTLQAVLANLEQLGLPGVVQVTVPGSSDKVSLESVMRKLQKQIFDQAAAKIQSAWRKKSANKAAQKAAIQKMFTDAVEKLELNEAKTEFANAVSELELVVARLANIAKVMKVQAEAYSVTITGTSYTIDEIGRALKRQIKQFHEAQQAAAAKFQNAFKGHQDRSAFLAKKKAAQDAVAGLTIKGDIFTQKMSVLNPVLATLRNMQEKNQGGLRVTIARDMSGVTGATSPNVTMTVDQVVQAIEHTAAIQIQKIHRGNQGRATAATAQAEKEKQEKAQAAVAGLTLKGTSFTQPSTTLTATLAQLKMLQNEELGAVTVQINNDMSGGGGMAPTTAMTINEVVQTIAAQQIQRTARGHQGRGTAQQAQQAKAEKEAQAKAEAEARAAATDTSTLSGKAILTALAQVGDAAAYPPVVYTKPVILNLWQTYLNSIARLASGQISFNVKAADQAELAAAIARTNRTRAFEGDTITVKGKKITLDACLAAAQDKKSIDVRVEVTFAQMNAYEKTGDLLVALRYACDPGSNNTTSKKYAALSEDQQKQLWVKYFTATTSPQGAKLQMNVDRAQQRKLQSAITACSINRRTKIRVRGHSVQLGVLFALGANNVSNLALDTNTPTVGQVIEIIQNAVLFAVPSSGPSAARNVFITIFAYYMNTFGWVHATGWGTYIGRRTAPASNSNAPASAAGFKAAINSAPANWLAQKVELNTYTSSSSSMPYKTPAYEYAISKWMTYKHISNA